MIAEWLDDLATGNEAIDAQKRELFRQINRFLRASSEGEGAEEVDGFLAFLKRYAAIFLLDEERFLLDRHYPLYAEHRQGHDEFVCRLTALDDRHATEGATQCVVIGAGRLALDWVVDHVYQADRAVAEFVRGSLRRHTFAGFR
jgi:hemerythrin